MQAIQGNRSAIDQIANALNCTTTQLQSAICNVQGAIDKVAGQVGMTSQAVINAVQQQGCEIGNQISSCCCNLSSLINQSTCQTQQQTQNLINQLRPTPVPAYPSCSPYQTYGWGQAFYGGNYGCGCNNGCCNNGNAAI